MAIVEVCNVDMNYHNMKGVTEAIKDINFTVDEGEFISIIGPSGCGKSTLLNIISGLIEPSKGVIKYKGSIVKDNLDNKKIDPAEYLQKGTPEEILNLVLPKIDKDRLSKLVNDPNFVNRRSVGENFALKLIVNTYTNKDNQAMVLELVKCYLNNHFEL